jgi:hypothetical protein
MPTRKDETVQGWALLTVSESKRLIGNGVAKMPIVTRALRSGTVIIARGSTNTYVAEEILGRAIPRGAFLTGRVYPEKGGAKLAPPEKPLAELVLRKGKVARDVSFDEALNGLEPGDVVMKGANALDYRNKTAGIFIGHPKSGTIGKIVPLVIARKAHLVIPVGLEKQVAGDVQAIHSLLSEPMESVGGHVCPLFPVHGHIVTEVEALQTLAGVSALHVGSGGIGGAEGSVRLVFRGTKRNVKEALALIARMRGEAPFVS